MSLTKIWRVDRRSPDTLAVAEAGKLLRDGGIVAFPTETVYGLGANARDTAAVERIFAAKGRPSDNPLIVHIADLAQLDALTNSCGETERRLIERFWPGPLTLVLPVRHGAVSPRVTAGLDTVAVRMPAHPVALALIAAAGCPVAAPSANSSGRPSPTEAAHVLKDLDGRIDGLVDGGSASVGLESTVVDIEGGTVRILRPGGVTAEQLREVTGRVEYAAAVPEGLSMPQAPRSPGMKYAHYAPQGVMQLVQGEAAATAAYINTEAAAARARGERTGVLAFAEHAGLFTADHIIVAGSLARLDEAARELYAALRSFDDLGVERIWAETCPEAGIGQALMNRLAKAAGHRIVRV